MMCSILRLIFFFTSILIITQIVPSRSHPGKFIPTSLNSQDKQTNNGLIGTENEIQSKGRGRQEPQDEEEDEDEEGDEDKEAEEVVTSTGTSTTTRKLTPAEKEEKLANLTAKGWDKFLFNLAVNTFLR